jgi:hypothetical protein
MMQKCIEFQKGVWSSGLVAYIWLTQQQLPRYTGLGTKEDTEEIWHLNVADFLVNFVLAELS